MPFYDKGQLGQEAKVRGFNRDTFEKVLRLCEILFYLNDEKFLREHLVLKGGTAINLTIFDLPRLSIGLDMDFIPNLSLEDMMEAREKINKLIKSYMDDEGYQLSDSSKYSHSLDSFLFSYQNAGGNKDILKLEINYSLRVHILEVVERKIIAGLFDDEILVKVLHPIEIFAAKANALMSRAAARDLYDFVNMINNKIFSDADSDMLRKCIIFYASISSGKGNLSFDISAIDNLTFNKIKRDLLPVLRLKEKFELGLYKEVAKNFMSNLMVLSHDEKEYIRLWESNNFDMKLLFPNRDIYEKLNEHPMLLWKIR